ncbi:MAG TPA: hypothetical protein VM513_33455 [Kofleriaceae bacterium]|jgi:hypothetical protein|nr:hypothetical protein [Kofleriaceae bacterium]
MQRIALPVVALAMLAGSAHAQGVYEVCKGESKGVVAGTGKPSIAVVYLSDFPVTTTPKMRNAVGAAIAKAEKAKIVPAKDVEAAKRLVDEKKWADKSEACGQAPSLVAALGLKHPNLSTATARVECSDGGPCMLHVDLERHGKRSAERWVRYSAPLSGPRDKVATIQAAAPKLVAKGPPPDAPRAGLAVAELAPGVVTVRSDVDGALESDRIMEGNPAFAACGPKKRKQHDVRGYWAEWKLSARGNPFQVMVKPFAGRDPADATAADCLKKALEATQLRCPRDGKVVDVKTAICL